MPIVGTIWKVTDWYTELGDRMVCESHLSKVITRMNELGEEEPSFCRRRTQPEPVALTLALRAQDCVLVPLYHVF